MFSLPRRPLFVAVAALGTLALAAPPAPAQSAATPGMGPVAQQEKAIWNALQSSQWDTAAAYMAPNFIYAGAELGDRAASKEGMKTCKLASYTLHDAQSRTLAPGIVLLSYVATVDENCAAGAYKGDLNCTSLWQQQNGKWMGVAHTEAIANKH